jgi:pimeloyl-ACP methyl ester carboxylesterase
MKPSGSEVADVPVPGGSLAVEVITSGTEPVLAIHGVSSQRKLWNWLRAVDPGISLIAPDLRGRGDSIDVAGDHSIGRHAADMVAVLDHLGIAAVHVCGMSMGGFVAVELATLMPDRVKSLILVDGGFPMQAPDGLTPASLPALFRDRLARVDRHWSSIHDYARFFVATTAPLLDPADPLLLDYLRHDLADGKVRLSTDALIADSADIFFGKAKWRNVGVPTRLLAAQWSRGQRSPPGYDDEALRTFEQGLGTLVTARRLAGADHAATIMSAAGAAATADMIAAALTKP